MCVEGRFHIIYKKRGPVFIGKPSSDLRFVTYAHAAYDVDYYVLRKPVEFKE